MKRLAFFLFLVAAPAFAQTTIIQQPDCILPLGLLTTAPANVPASTGFDNRTKGCNTWAIDYNSFGFTVLSLVVQTAPNATGNIPGSWSTFTAVTGINPNTATTQAVTTFGSATSYFPWIRVRLSSVTGTGSITGVLYGWKIPAAGSSGCAGTIADPCVVVGPTPVGQAPTQAPVQMGGWDSFNDLMTRLVTDTNGNLLNSPLATSGAGSSDISDSMFVPLGNTGAAAQPLIQQVFPYAFNGSTWAANFLCTNQALFNLSGSGNTQIIALSGSTTIRICHISMSTTAPEDIKITRGTGSDCSTGTADVTGLYKSVQALAFDFQPTAALRGAAAGAICVNQSAAQATGGVVIYAQF